MDEVIIKVGKREFSFSGWDERKLKAFLFEKYGAEKIVRLIYKDDIEKIKLKDVFNEK